MFEALARDLRDRGDLDLSETFIDGTFAPAKKESGTWDLPVEAKARRSWRLQTALVFLPPSAQKVLRQNEVTLVERTLEARFVEDLPERLIGDKAYDSDRLDARLLEKYRIEMIFPNREGNRPTQDGRPLRRYKRRWKIERHFAWFTQFRRIPVRYEYWIENYLSFLHLACILILLRCF